MIHVLVERVELVNKLGIHARSASKFVGVAKTYACQVKIGVSETDMQNGKSIMGVLKLAAQRGATIILQTDGEEEQEAMTQLMDLIADRFGEPD